MSRSRLRGSIEIKDSANSGNSFLQEATSDMIDNGMLQQRYYDREKANVSIMPLAP